MIPSGDAGIQLFVRNKHPAGKETSLDKILLLVHGATYPAETDVSICPSKASR